MRVRPRERPCPDGGDGREPQTRQECAGFCPRTFRAKRRTGRPSESEAFARENLEARYALERGVAGGLVGIGRLGGSLAAA